MNSPTRDSRLAPAKACGIPIRLEPQFVERVWGAPGDSDEIASLYPEGSNPPRRIGEVWLTGNENRITNGAWAGKSLRDLTGSCGDALLGAGQRWSHPTGAPVFPLLIKFLFTTEKLSVQVHPPDDAAQSLGSWGKTEMWHILRAAHGARLAVGFRNEVSSEFLQGAAELREATTNGTIEQMLDWREVHAGETYFVPAGTVHAIGAGIVLCEIQQNSDITYRLYDYKRPGTDGKPRALHVGDAIKVIDANVEGGRTNPYDWSDETGERRLLAACPYFTTERWDLRGDLQRPATKRLEIWIGLVGKAELVAGASRELIEPGQAVVIPADAGAFTVHPAAQSVLLRIYPPDWQRDIVEPLRKMGKSVEQLPRTVFPMSVKKDGVAR